MRNNTIWLLGLGAVGLYFFTRNKSVLATGGTSSDQLISGANTGASIDYPIVSLINPTSVRSVVPTSVLPVPTPASFKGTTLKSSGPAIQIREGGKDYIAPYKIVNINGPQGVSSGISFSANKYTSISPGFAAKMKKSGLA